MQMATLSVITPVGPGQQELCDQTATSIKQASAGAMAFSEIKHVIVDDTDGNLGPADAKNRGIDIALSNEASWLFFLEAGDLLTNTSLKEIEPFLQDYDGIWGVIMDMQFGQLTAYKRQGQSDDISGYKSLITSDPRTSLGRGFFIKATALSDFRFDDDEQFAHDYKMFADLWETCKCIKANKVFCVNRHGVPTTGRYVVDKEKKISSIKNMLVERCQEASLTQKFVCLGKTMKFSITNPFDIIQRSFINDKFFEERELFALKGLIPSGGVIIDAGANIGNHTVFFSQYLNADTVVPFECNPDAVDILTKNLTNNSCDNIILSHLGIGLSNKETQGTLDETKVNNLGATSFKHQSNGEITFTTIDSFSFENVTFIKVDCEGMDLDVLKGALETIKRCKPVLLFECFNEQYDNALTFLSEIGYMPYHEFKYVFSRNIIARVKP